MHKNSEIQNQSIGVFDSGIGGLTVVRELMKQLPYENIVYFGDTARVPYGSKSPGVVRRYALEDANLLINQGVKMVVVACNTVSAIALDDISRQYSIPTIGVIIPGARAALLKSINRKIGVIGTIATINANAYVKQLQIMDKFIFVSSQACPLFVPLAEEGWQYHTATQIIADEYLIPLQKVGIDTLILGCTHYPILKKAIQKSVGEDVTLIDSAQETAREVGLLLDELKLRNRSSIQPNYQFIVSDIPQKFHEIAERFLGLTIGNVLKVDPSIH